MKGEGEKEGGQEGRMEGGSEGKRLEGNKGINGPPCIDWSAYSSTRYPVTTQVLV